MFLHFFTRRAGFVNFEDRSLFILKWQLLANFPERVHEYFMAETKEETIVVSCWSVLCVSDGVCHIPLFCMINSRTSLDCDKFPYTRVASSTASMLEQSTNFNITEVKSEWAAEKREMGVYKGEGVGHQGNGRGGVQSAECTCCFVLIST